MERSCSARSWPPSATITVPVMKLRGAKPETRPDRRSPRGLPSRCSATSRSQHLGDGGRASRELLRPGAAVEQDVARGHGVDADAFGASGRARPRTVALRPPWLPNRSPARRARQARRSTRCTRWRPPGRDSRAGRAAAMALVAANRLRSSTRRHSASFSWPGGTEAPLPTLHTRISSRPSAPRHRQPVRAPPRVARRPRRGSRCLADPAGSRFERRRRAR